MWKRAVFALFAVAAGTNVPTPLLLVYQERLDLSAEVLTALFGADEAAGNWQVIYRAARNLTLRAQAGEDSAVDVIWTWRWR